MDFDQLHAFLEVVRLKSFSRAAVTCFRTQPAISAQIRLLEEEVGGRLLDRGGGPVALTEAGRVFHAYAEKLCQLRREAVQALGDREQPPRGELHIAANEAGCLHVLPGVFAAFRDRHPAVRVAIRRGERQEILACVLENRADFGIVSLPADDKRLRVVPLHRDEIVAAVGRAHPLAAAAGALAPAALAAHGLLLPRRGRTRDAIEQWMADGRATPQIAMELDSTELQKAFCASGLGVAFLARGAARAEAERGELRLFELSGRRLARELGLIFRRDRALGRAALAFIAIAAGSPPGES